MTSANNAMTYIRFIMLKISDTTGEANKKGTSMLSHLEYSALSIYRGHCVQYRVILNRDLSRVYSIS